MAFTHYLANKVLVAEFKGVAKDDKVWVMLHTDAPDHEGDGHEAVDGKADIARKFVEMDETPAAGGGKDNEQIITNTNEIEWEGDDIDAAQDLTHFSLWDDENKGNCLAVSAITAAPRTVGSDGVKIEIGALEVAVGVWEEDPGE